MGKRFITTLAAIGLLSLPASSVLAGDHSGGGGGYHGGGGGGGYHGGGGGYHRGGGNYHRGGGHWGGGGYWGGAGYWGGGYYGGRSGAQFGLYVGSPGWGPAPWPYYQPYYDAPRTVIIENSPPIVVQQTPPVYIQREAAAPVEAPAAQLWFYCPKPAGYHPYVAECQQQWVPVDPRSLPPVVAR